MKRLAFIITLTGLAVTLSAQAQQQVGFEETFALAPDRAAALKQLAPGTQEYYYYNCLQHLNLASADAKAAPQELRQVQDLLKAWIERYGEGR